MVQANRKYGHPFLSAIIGLGMTFLFSGCGLLIGNIKPVDEKSETYEVADLSMRSPAEWVKLPQQAAGPSNDTASSDVAFQSRKTSSIISLNSACRPSFATEEKNLREFTNLLFLGISDVAQRDEKTVEIQNLPALQTTLRGKLNTEEMMLRTLVLRRDECVYDLMYVTRPEHFADNEPDFAHFVASLRLR